MATVVAQEPNGIEDYMQRVPPTMLERTFKSLITVIMRAVLCMLKSKLPIAIFKGVDLGRQRGCQVNFIPFAHSSSQKYAV